MNHKYLLLTLVLVAVLGVIGFLFTNRSPSGTTITSRKDPAKAPPIPEALQEDNPPEIPKPIGMLKGRVIYDGDPPDTKFITIPKNMPNTEGCHLNVVDESLVVDKSTKGLKWAIIRVLDVKSKYAPPKPAKPYQIDQMGCTFTPHVVVVPPNTDLEILNPDKILHNIRTLPYDSDDPPQNIASQGPIVYKAKWLKEPDLIEIKCDIYGWMKGLIVCHDPRYCAVTGADGTFEIKHLAPGKYKVNVFHESFGNYMKKETIDIEIKAGATIDLGEMKFTPKK